MKKKILICFFLMVCLCGCVAEQDAGENEYGLPEITDFSEYEIEDFERSFPAPDRAVLSVDGETVEIAGTDPRLIRLLNYILYSENDQSDVLVTELKSEKQVQVYYDNSPAWLHVYFGKAEKTDFVPNLTELLIVADRYLLFGSNDHYAFYVEEHYPYGMNLWNWAEKNQVDSRPFFYNLDHPEYDLEHPWINLLQISGFIS